MTSNRRKRSGGNTVVEFTLVGIPLIFLLISTFEMARGMWLYHTLAFAVKEGTRYAVVHGKNCTMAPNTCSVTIAKIATVIRSAAIGIPADSLTLTFTPETGAATTCTMSHCISTYTTGYWPPAAANSPKRILKISGVYPFRSAIIMLWPGAGTQRGAPGVINFSAASRESIQF